MSSNREKVRSEEVPLGADEANVDIDNGESLARQDVVDERRCADEEELVPSPTTPIMEEPVTGTVSEEQLPLTAYQRWRLCWNRVAAVAASPITAMNSSYRRFRHRWRHALFFQDKLFRLVVVIGVFVIAFGWTILILFFVQNGRQPPLPPPGKTGNARPTPAPMNGATPSTFPTYVSTQPSRSPMTAPPAAIQDAIEWLFPFSSNQTVWYDPLSPQYRAAAWLGFEDQNWQTRFPPNDPVKLRGRYALAVLHFACGGDLLSSSDECDWGKDQWKIQCTDGNKHVERISFDRMNLTCELPEELGLLEELRQLRLPSNNLSGRFDFISKLQSLNWLDLRNNSYSGNLTVDWWADMRHLWILDLSHNQFSGPLPSSMVGLPILKHLRLSNNSLSGPVDLLSTFPSIADIQLGHNQFSGPLVDATFLADNLLTVSLLDLNDNRLTGTIPRRILESTRLLGFNLANNNLRGTIPNASNLPRIRKIDFSNNELTGTLPTSFGSNFFELVHLDLSRNHLEGTIPWMLNDDQRNSFRRLETFYLEDNFLTGTIPSFLLTSLSSLEAFSVSGNTMDGTIPPGISNSLQLLNLGGCRNLSGTIPNKLPNRLQYLFLNCNNLTGTLPSTLTNLTNLKVLRVDGTKMEGRVEEELCERVMEYDEETATALTPGTTTFLVARDPIECVCCSECYDQVNCDSCRPNENVRLGTENLY